MIRLATELVESTLNCDQTIGPAAHDVNSIQRDVDDKPSRKDTLVANLHLSLSLPSLSLSKLIHTTRGGPRACLPWPECGTLSSSPPPMTMWKSSSGYSTNGPSILVIVGGGRQTDISWRSTS